jgi:hypothetical protein
VNTWTKYDVATMAIGLASVASLVSLLLNGDLRFAAMQGAAIGVAVVLGVLAILAGAVMQPRLAAAVGLMFLAAAVLQVILVTLRETWLGGNTATAALWLGLGIGLLVLGVSRRPTTEVNEVWGASDTK